MKLRVLSDVLQALAARYTLHSLSNSIAA